MKFHERVRGRGRVRDQFKSPTFPSRVSAHKSVLYIVYAGYPSEMNTENLSSEALLETRYDVAVVGAGIAGCAMAFALGNQGRKVLLIERSLAEPDRIVGELLQPGGYNALKALGMGECLDEIDAIAVNGYAVFRETDSVRIPYPLESELQNGVVQKGCEDQQKIYAEGRSFHYGKFVMRLRQKAKESSNVTIMEATVNDLLTENKKIVGVSCTRRINDQNEIITINVPLTIVADGCFSKFRTEATKRDPVTTSHFVGFILHSCKLPFQNHGHVILGVPSPVLFYQIGTNETRVLVDVPLENPPRRGMKSSWTWEKGAGPRIGDGSMKRWLQEVVAESLPDSVKSSFLKALQTERLRIMPNGYLPPSTQSREGMILLGDAMNMRHPLTGGGMTVALTDVVMLRDLLSPKDVPSLDENKLIRKQMGEFYWKRKHLSSVVNILAGALYALFSAKDENLHILGEACLAYFKQGGDCIEGPVGLLSGLTPSPIVLIYHFFAVAFVGMGMVLRSGGLVDFPRNVVGCLVVLKTAVTVIGPLLFAEMFPDSWEALSRLFIRNGRTVSFFAIFLLVLFMS